MNADDFTTKIQAERLIVTKVVFEFLPLLFVILSAFRLIVTKVVFECPIARCIISENWD